MFDRIEYMKAYRLANRATITEKYQEYMKTRPDKFTSKTECACGGSYVYQAKSNHLKSKMHLRYLSRIKEDNEIE
tara:strand:+ start:517 stop:741 length:225 start_codon:yes stop_codon:yes gene_type:complete